MQKSDFEFLLDWLEWEAWQEMYRQATSLQLRRVYGWKVLKLQVKLGQVSFPK